jgi:hypothetical protein
MLKGLMDDREFQGRRLGYARALAAGVITSMVALSAWGALTPAIISPAVGFSAEAYFLYQDALRATLAWGWVVAIGPWGLAWLGWSRIVEARRFGDRHSPKRPRDVWVWAVGYPVAFLFVYVVRPFETVFPVSTISLESGAWAVSPANAARWFMLAVVAWAVADIGWRWYNDATSARKSPAEVQAT